MSSMHTRGPLGLMNRFLIAHTSIHPSLTNVSVLSFLLSRISLFSALAISSFPSTRTCTSVTTWMRSSRFSISVLEPREFFDSNGITFPSPAERRPSAALRESEGPPLYGPYLVRAEENTPGRQRAISGRKQGRLEQMMPTLASTELQVAAGGLSYVGSAEFEIETRDWRRRIETIQTLVREMSARIAKPNEGSRRMSRATRRY
ncbi:hypothetical protein BU26DRAFT_322814 [Trematosphaeria pertusa]|uniref:Uncharacterized protein n=1 Tax=Trematosphaeria pertusa TaxID=390896 RepID=A0A6A6ICH6_9PLEO|nr:uncharacterized protein BU26DRAFT_322814 [Trematosphaeria pertusa]KAF2247907.1 hypothetical protein BU26DRAFT_322814 [Trematosphaeria pertusa]